MKYLNSMDVTETHNICRTCLITVEDETNIESVTPLLEECFQIKINIDETLPQKLCTQCEQTIRNFHQFKRQVHEIESVFSQHDSSVTLRLQKLIRQYDAKRNGSTVDFSAVKLEIDDVDDEEIFDDLPFFTNEQIKSSPFRAKKRKHHALKTSRSRGRRKLKEEKVSEGGKLSDSDDSSDSRRIKRKLKRLEESPVNGDLDDTEDGSPAKKRKIKRIKKEILDGALDCRDCGEKFPDSDMLELHQTTEHKDGYKCPECGQRYANQWTLKRHVTVMHKNDIPCDSCSVHVTTLKKLVEHAVTKHGAVKNIKCAYCSEEFYLKQQLERHMKDINFQHIARMNKNPYVCDSSEGCGKKYYSLFQLGTHVRRAHGILRNFECEYCHCAFTLRLQLEKHVRYCAIRHLTASERTTYACPRENCEEEYGELHLLSAHMMRCQIPKQYDCKWCGAMFCLEIELERHTEDEEHEPPDEGENGAEASSGILCQLCNIYVRKFNKHMLQHERETRVEFQCTYCTNKFPTRQLLRNHVKRSHRKRKMCQYCGKLNVDTQHLMRHEGGSDDTKMNIKHEGGDVDKDKRVDEKAFIPCEQCGKTFTSKTGLSAHMNVVHFPKMVQCYVCHNMYKQKQIRQHVLRVHQKTRKYACSFCEYKTKTASNLKGHMLIHTDERPHMCPYCPQAFRDRKVLKHHVMRHTGEKPHACAVCDKRFIQRTAWLTHMKTHQTNRTASQPTTTTTANTGANERTYPCVSCDKTFRHASALNIHKCTHLPNQELVISY